ncbi:phosphoglycerate kinase [Stappia sp. GBMRC 2046]|uniref:Phosphoglycerate kinase n=1 Tax=Stappia sediminis TaxID=2692190 RepID=A0A7X3LRW5_9HYPH|nr:phosphoglycerate kinase [Stappia sediminis]MXN63980.1 phosphoglycerate kinase [Stappia sediminis]
MNIQDTSALAGAVDEKLVANTSGPFAVDAAKMGSGLTARYPDIRQAQVRHKTVLVRADLDVPLDGGVVADAGAIERFAPTVVGLIERGAKVIVMAHLGMPQGEPNPTLSTFPIAVALGEVLERGVQFIPDCVGETAERVTGNLPDGGIAFLENLRFHKGETENSRAFALMLSVHGDIFVNDAPFCSQWVQASTNKIAEILPPFAGPNMVAKQKKSQILEEN